MKEIVAIYKKYGFSCLPTQKDKSPKKGLKWKDVDIDVSEFTEYGIGIKCGKESFGLECLDFDNHFGDAKQILSEFLNIPEVKNIYQTYKLPIESTMTGGFHLLFRCEHNEGNLKLAQRPKWNEEKKEFRPDTIIETRGEGGYFVAAPTSGYKVIRNKLSEVNEILKEERKILIDNAQAFNEWIDYRHTDFENSDKPGDYYNERLEAIEDMKSCLLKHGWKHVRGHTWRRSNKKEGTSATLGKVAPNVFYVFSSNAYPFEPRSGYKPFQVVGLLDYNGDFKKFASDLAKKYNLSTPDTYYKKQPEKKEEPKQMTVNEKETLLSERYIDTSIPVEKPPIIMYINHGTRKVPIYRRIMTLGNFSCLIGKSKSKKTFILTKIMACFGVNFYDNEAKFKAELPDNKMMVLHFDTEQSEYDSYITAKRIHDIAGQELNHVGSWALREDNPNKRVELIEHAIEKYKNNIGIVFIDGIADLVHTINNEELANEILQKFMYWTKKYSCHICCIIHQNKNDNWATGWLGTQILKKAELIMSVEKDSDNNDYSKVSCEMIRGAKEFNPFYFYIDENNIPVILENYKSNTLR